MLSNRFTPLCSNTDSDNIDNMNNSHHEVGANLSFQKGKSVDNRKFNKKCSKHSDSNLGGHQIVSTYFGMSNCGVIDDKYNLALSFDSKREELVSKYQSCVPKQSSCVKLLCCVPKMAVPVSRHMWFHTLS